MEVVCRPEGDKKTLGTWVVPNPKHWQHESWIKNPCELRGRKKRWFGEFGGPPIAPILGHTQALTFVILWLDKLCGFPHEEHLRTSPPRTSSWQQTHLQPHIAVLKTCWKRKNKMISTFGRRVHHPKCVYTYIYTRIYIYICVLYLYLLVCLLCTYHVQY